MSDTRGDMDVYLPGGDALFEIKHGETKTFIVTSNESQDGVFKIRTDYQILQLQYIGDTAKFIYLRDRWYYFN
jgi:hypothetical protein